MSLLTEATAAQLYVNLKRVRDVDIAESAEVLALTLKALDGALEDAGATHSGSAPVSNVRENLHNTNYSRVDTQNRGEKSLTRMEQHVTARDAEAEWVRGDVTYERLGESRANKLRSLGNMATEVDIAPSWDSIQLLAGQRAPNQTGHRLARLERRSRTPTELRLPIAEHAIADRACALLSWQTRRAQVSRAANPLLWPIEVPFKADFRFQTGIGKAGQIAAAEFYSSWCAQLNNYEAEKRTNRSSIWRVRAQLHRLIDYLNRDPSREHDPYVRNAAESSAEE
ncbi:hypothetical protein VSR82_36170 [Burkholderia sp. JPY481]